MIFALQGFLAFNTTAERDQVVQFLTTGGKPKVPPTTGGWTNRVMAGTQYDTGKPGLALDVRYSTKKEADDLWADILNALSTMSVQPGSFLYAHDCTEDTPGTNNCVVTLTQNW